MGNIEVKVTNNYELFKKMEGNRAVLEPRVKKIINSIQKVGYVINPLIVNENYEVIDGQGRLEALKRLEMPVYYIIAPGIGLNECVAMNINQTNWTIPDYINSYAETGNTSYIYLQELFNTYHKSFQLDVIIYAATMNSYRNTKKIKDGEIECTKEEYERAQEVLAWLMRFVPIFSKMAGHTEIYYQVLIYCYLDEEVDNDRLYKKITALQASLIPVTTVMQTLDKIEEIYNNCAKTKVYIKTNYRKMQDEKNAWYSAKYGDKYNE